MNEYEVATHSVVPLWAMTEHRKRNLIASLPVTGVLLLDQPVTLVSSFEILFVC